MNKNKTTKVIATIIVALAFVLIIVALIISLSNKDNTKSEYKQCGKKDDGITNYEHTGLNYYIDENNNRINNSEVLFKKHDSRVDETKIYQLSIDEMTIKSENCDENAAEMKAKLTNNSGQDLADFMLIFDIKDKEGKNTHKFSMDIKSIKKEETIDIRFKTIGRIIDAYDYEFTYASVENMEG